MTDQATLDALNDAISALIRLRDRLQPGPKETAGERGVFRAAGQLMSGGNPYVVRRFINAAGGVTYEVLDASGQLAPHPSLFPDGFSGDAHVRCAELNAMEAKPVPQ